MSWTKVTHEGKVLWENCEGERIADPSKIDVLEDSQRPVYNNTAWRREDCDFENEKPSFAVDAFMFGLLVGFLICLLSKA